MIVSDAWTRHPARVGILNLYKRASTHQPYVMKNEEKRRPWCSRCEQIKLQPGSLKRRERTMGLSSALPLSNMRECLQPGPSGAAGPPVMACILQATSNWRTLWWPHWRPDGAAAGAAFVGLHSCAGCCELKGKYFVVMAIQLVQASAGEPTHLRNGRVCEHRQPHLRQLGQSTLAADLGQSTLD